MSVPIEQYANTAQTTTTGPVSGSSSPVTLTVAAAAAFPAAGQFRVVIDSEILLVTAVAGSSFTAARAQEGTTIAAHASGATVTHVLTAGSLQTIIGQFALSDLSANRPAAGVTGRLFFPLDGGPVFRDNGSSWDCWVNGLGPFTPPLSTFTAFVNQSLAARAVTNNVPTLLYHGASTGTENVNVLTQPVPGSTFTFTGVFSGVMQPGWQNVMGICLYDSVSGRVLGLDLSVNDNPLTLLYNTWNSPTSFNVNVQTQTIQLNAGPVWMFRIKCDGTNYYLQMSVDFINWITWEQFSVSGSWVPVPTHVGFFLDLLNLSAGQSAGMTIWHAGLTSP